MARLGLRSLAVPHLLGFEGGPPDPDGGRCPTAWLEGGPGGAPPPGFEAGGFGGPPPGFGPSDLAPTAWIRKLVHQALVLVARLHLDLKLVHRALVPPQALVPPRALVPPQSLVPLQSLDLRQALVLTHFWEVPSPIHFDRLMEWVLTHSLAVPTHFFGGPDPFFGGLTHFLAVLTHWGGPDPFFGSPFGPDPFFDPSSRHQNLIFSCPIQIPCFRT